MASNEVGVFSLEMTAPQAQFAEPTIGHEEVRMEDLLQAQFDNELNLLLFDGMATFSINMLIHQINRSECALSRSFRMELMNFQNSIRLEKGFRDLGSW